MKYIFDDGGRAAAGYKGSAGDCACRAVSIAAGLPYSEVYDGLNAFASRERTGKRKRGKSSARSGVHSATMRRYMASIGWTWTPTMKIGSGCNVHLTDGELPMGRLVVLVSKHYTAVIDGEIRDTHNPQRTTIFYENGKPMRFAKRCVYGYFSKESVQ
jgi:hypothetical protein